MTETNVANPVPSAPSLRPRKRANVVRLAVVGVIIVGALGFLIFKGLDDATVYFRTASEAVADRQQLGTQRFRIEGVVQAGSIAKDGEFTNFVITDKDVSVNVRNTGQPLGIFQENIPVVLEGHFAPNSDTYLSDRIMVKHDNNYAEQHPDRVSGAANQ